MGARSKVIVGGPLDGERQPPQDHRERFTHHDHGSEEPPVEYGLHTVYTINETVQFFGPRVPTGELLAKLLENYKP